MADLLERVQRELDERLAELRPLVEEARQLEAALAALERDEGASATPRRRLTASERPAPILPPRMERTRPLPKPAAAPEQPSEAETAERRKRDEAEGRQRRVLAIITENPGTTAGNLALLLDTSVPMMGAMLRRLEREGEIEKAEKGYARKTTSRGTAN
jgi:hypothetical protein